MGLAASGMPRILAVGAGGCHAPGGRVTSLCTAASQSRKSYRATVALGQKAFADVDADVGAHAPEELVRAILAARTRAPH